MRLSSRGAATRAVATTRLKDISSNNERLCEHKVILKFAKPAVHEKSTNGGHRLQMHIKGMGKTIPGIG